MPYGLYISAEGADVQRRRLEVLANNLANVETPGFKRELAIAQERHAEEIQRGLAAAGSGSLNDVGGGVMTRETMSDFAPGPFKETGQRTDLAIDGPGMFAVSTPRGVRYTRAGDFSIDRNQRLVTQQGYAVLADDGQPITISDPEWSVSDRGEIRQGGGLTPLRIVQQDPRALRHEAENLFVPLGDEEPARLAPNQRTVRGGFLEGSSVSPVSEMALLIEATRAYEANVRMIQNHDSVLGQLFGRVLKA